jgi:geranylgeranyl pyrophosphate synthase
VGGVRLDGRDLRVKQGSAWYDHEFGRTHPETEPVDSQRFRERIDPRDSVGQGEESGERQRQRGETCWRWLSLQLDDCRELSAFYITRRATGEVLDRWTMLVDPSGETRAFDDTELETLETWRSTRTFVEYPIAFRVRVPSAGVDVRARASFPDQEVVSVISDPAFWEGTVEVVGTLRDRPVRGRGWLECKGFGHATLDDFYASVGREVRSRLALALPRCPEGETALAHLMVRGSPGKERPAGLGVDGRRLGAALVAPIREIADRGGKGWRSYAALACIDLVGGDSRRFLHWLIMPEIVHVGSLIVDDVEDESSVRRGGPTCHLMHGTASAINAGTAAYFLAEPPVDQDALPDHKKLAIYRLYFDAMRAGHAGQALDLCDVSGLAEAAAATGDTRELQSHVLSVHRLKAAVPAAMFARAGALLGGGTDHQVECVGRFFESVGLAFQIVDDVLNISGFAGNLKERGEDLRIGKVTLPVVKALSLLDPESRAQFWQTLSQRPEADAVIVGMCEQLVECGALRECRKLAESIVDAAWEDLDRAVEDSQFKLMLRAFSWYVLERHY